MLTSTEWQQAYQRNNKRCAMGTLPIDVGDDDGTDDGDDAGSDSDDDTFHSIAKGS